jgi:D-3-phosphoglycerate dehydrogenase
MAEILMAKKYYVFDFDSTLTQVEAFEELADIALKKNPEKHKIVQKIKEITDWGIDGKISFTQSLEQRIHLLHAHKDHLEILVKRLKKKISPSISRNKEFFKKNASSIYVISAGFKEFIDPIVKQYNIDSKRVYANTFKYDKKGNITGFDSKNLLSKHNGKIDQLKAIHLPGEVYVIGDGYSDYVMREAGLAHKFFAFTENVARANILTKADHITPSLDEFLYVNKLPMSISYPKNRIKALLLENVHDDAVQLFRSEGYEVQVMKKGLREDELCEAVKGISILGVRSKTQLSKRVLDHADRLMAIGAFCIGTNQIDLDSCTRKGICVFNAPYSNTRSVVEMALGEMIMLMRRTFDQSMKMHNGIWEKSASHSNEIRGKKLGIIGYGNIGSQLSVMAEALGMQVYYYDVLEKLALGNAHKAESLKDLLKKADIISVHVDGNKMNKNLIGEKEFKLMKEGAIFLNLSRGFVVDVNALAENIKNGKIRGAALDVFPEEPHANIHDFYTELRGLPNVILTPHVGGSTEEAQKNIADYVPSRMIDYINTGNSFASINFPNIQLPTFPHSHRFLHIHENVPGMLAQINSVLAKFNVNVEGQYLKTNEQIGYLITDINKKYNQEVIRDLKKISNTIRFRVLY